MQGKRISTEQCIGILREEASHLPYGSVEKQILLDIIGFLQEFPRSCPPTTEVVILLHSSNPLILSCQVVEKTTSKPIAQIKPHNPQSNHSFLREDKDFSTADRIQAVREADKVLDKMMGK